MWKSENNQEMEGKKNYRSPSKDSVGNLNSTFPYGYGRRTLNEMCSQSPSKNERSTSPRKKKDGYKLTDGQPSQSLYPTEDSYFDEQFGGSNEEEYKQEYEDHLADDDANDEVDLHEVPSYKSQIYQNLQKDDSVSNRRRRQLSPPPISKPPKVRAQPIPTSSYKLLNVFLTLVVILCAIAAIIFGVPYWPKLLEKLQVKNLVPLPVSDIIQNLKNDFGEQPPMTFKVIGNELRRVTKPSPEAPAIILLLAERGAEKVALRFARAIADSVSSSSNKIVISGPTYDTDDHDAAKKDFDVLLSDNLGNVREGQLGAVIVEKLDRIPAVVAGILHTYVDHENAPFKRVVYLMTIESSETQLKSMELKDWEVVVNDHLLEAWKNGGNDQVTSLLSRLTVGVAAIVRSG